jgi:hypothetical protein
MERGCAVRAGRHVRRGLLWALLLLGMAPLVRAADRLVLIVSAQSPVTDLSSIDLQKMFLGLTVVRGGEALHPLRDDSDPLMHQIFFQDIISMSESRYEDRLLAFALQQGRPAPPVYHSSAELLRAIEQDPYAVSYAWATEVARDPRIRILRVLWSE